MTKCLPWKHVFVTQTEFDGTQQERCKNCGATK